MRNQQNHTPIRPLQHAVPAMLHEAGAERAPKQTPSCKHACSHCAASGSTQTRGRCAVRRPGAGETPLSWDEVVVLLAELGRIA